MEGGEKTNGRTEQLGSVNHTRFLGLSVRPSACPDEKKISLSSTG